MLNVNTSEFIPEFVLNSVSLILPDLYFLVPLSAKVLYIYYQTDFHLANSLATRYFHLAQALR